MPLQWWLIINKGFGKMQNYNRSLCPDGLFIHYKHFHSVITVKYTSDTERGALK